jgi:hypothetical protein
MTVYELNKRIFSQPRFLPLVEMTVYELNKRIFSQPRFLPLVEMTVYELVSVRGNIHTTLTTGINY